MRAELKELQQRVGATMVYVTHDQVEALTLGDRIAVLRDGMLQQVGTPDDVFGRPANRFVAGFVGSPAMNFFPARLSESSLRLGPAADGDGRAVEAGIRPERVRLGGERGEPSEVRFVEPAGSEAFVHVQHLGTAVVVRVPGSERPRVGDAVRVAIDLRDVHLFDAETGERVDWTP
jgi:multiple sugar transport system ATP-binding protein